MKQTRVVRFVRAFLLVVLLPAGLTAQCVQPNGSATELVGREWLNSPSGKPITLASRLGNVTVVHFWTFGCINCRHNLPIYDRWHNRFSAKDVLVIGIHTPETESERKPANVSREVHALGIRYPVLIDSKYVNWERWHQQFWPTVYVIDRKGNVRCRWEGELNYGRMQGEAELTSLIGSLLAEKP